MSILVIYTVLTRDELGEIPPYCPSSAAYSVTVTINICRIRLANLVLMWLFELFGILWVIAYGMGKLPKGNRSSNVSIDGEFENLDDTYSDDELAAEKIKNGKNNGKKRGSSRSRRGIRYIQESKDAAVIGGRRLEVP
ncbi:3209_t:CDS:1 [Cetraspora pellucida]|uniref:3209_t:CDS:1 n=1 Tax=Cetraspora pellucida TaxID=1433469 RepID=A0A9N9IG63_9GLOM|nr:3209_t:CDS:1 [Cetraspora pellucida]